MPLQHVSGLGPKDALMQMASEAVRVAAQSPFLESAVGRAKAVLCCLYLPALSHTAAGCMPHVSCPSQCPSHAVLGQA
jgi:hypothetical protein